MDSSFLSNIVLSCTNLASQNSGRYGCMAGDFDLTTRSFVPNHKPNKNFLSYVLLPSNSIERGNILNNDNANKNTLLKSIKTNKNFAQNEKKKRFMFMSNLTFKSITEHLQVENTDRKLEDLSWKVEKWERAVSQVSLFEDASPQLESEQEDCVFNLLQDVTQVREDYEQLRSDITEIQQLQRELSECLRTQLHHMHAKYGFLRSKLGPALPSCLMMSTNSYRASPTKHSDSRSDTNSQ